jgi:CubicO group peptidase (beta-lactamase class C family)
MRAHDAVERPLTITGLRTPATSPPKSMTFSMTNALSMYGNADHSNWREPDRNRWAFGHIDEIIATAQVYNNFADISSLVRASKGLGDSMFRRAVLKAIRTDAIVVLRNGKIMFEWYAQENGPHTRHILMSSTKAVIGLLAGMLHETGEFNLDALVSRYVPEIATTAYQGATIRNLLDMRTGVVLDRAQEHAYKIATNWQPLPAGERSADLVSFFQNLTAPQKAHGGPFSYVSANTDLLGWAMERAVGQRIPALLSARLWRPMGAEDAAYFTVDRNGLARCAGGLCATARDLARLGQLIVDNGRRGDRQIIAEAVISDIVNNGDTDAWRNGEWVKSFSRISTNMRYRSGWYLVDDRPRTMFAMGIHGQHLFIDRANRIVVAKLSSCKKRIDSVSLWLTHRGFERLQRALAVNLSCVWQGLGGLSRAPCLKEKLL